MLKLHGEFWMWPLQVKIYVTPHAWFSVQSDIRNEYTTNSGINSTSHTLCALGVFVGVCRALALIHDTWSAVNFCATLQVIRNKTVRMRILKACQMIRLGAVIWTAQDHWQNHSPFVVHLALGDIYLGLNFDQSKIRQLLLKGITMMSFPETKAGPCYQTYFSHMEIELFCTCQMPETCDDMVECDTCGDWSPQVCGSRAISSRRWTMGL